MTRKKVSCAFTQIELLIVISIIGILFVGTQYWYDIIDRYRISNDISRLTQLVSFANNIALVKGRTVSLCKSSDGKICGGSWEQGQLAFFDRGVHQVTAPEDIIQFSGALSHGAHLQWKGFKSNDYISFCGDGDSAASNGTFHYQRHGKTRELIISRSARPRVLS